jgi:hypothetical protein
MVLSLALLAAATAGGAILTLLWDADSPLLPRLAAGAVLGTALLGLFGYPLAAYLGLRPLSVTLAALLVAAPIGLLALPSIRARLQGVMTASMQALAQARGQRGAWLRAAALALLAVILLSCFDRAFFLRPDGLYTGDDHNLADLPFHLAIVQGFAEGGRFPPEHPDLAGVRLTYPFLADFVAAQLVRVGASLRAAFFLENALLALALLVLLHRSALRLTGDRAAAAIVPWLVFLSGGLGFIEVLGDADPLRGGLVGLLAHLPHDYTIRFEGGLRFGNVVTTMLIPQRAFLLGFPLAVLAVTLLWEAVTSEDEAVARRTMLAAGVVAGLMPLAHAHSFVVVLGTALCLVFLFPRRAWLRFAITAAVVALPVILWMAYDSPTQAGRFLGWQLGWDRGRLSPFVFWMRNAGVFLVLAVVGFLWGGAETPVPPRLRRFLAPFALCFVVPNVVHLSPWIWDNIKILIYGYIFAAPLVALLLVWLWREGGWARPAAAALGLSAVLSGGLDVGRVASRQIAHRLFDADGLAFARAVTAATAPDAVIIHAPTHETPLFLSGRRSFLGFPGHLWSQGLDAGNREADLQRIYGGALDTPSLVLGYGIDYLVLGPQEEGRPEVNRAFVGALPEVVSHGPYQLLDLRAVIEQGGATAHPLGPPPERRK